MTIDLEQFKQTFFEESFEGVEIMESGLLALDLNVPDMEDINAIFRAAHSIKGGSGTFGFSQVAEYTHEMETLLDAMRSGDRQVDSLAVDTLLKGVDVLKGLLSAAQDGTDEKVEGVEESKLELKALISSEQPIAPSTHPDEAVEPSNQSDSEFAKKGWHIVFQPHSQFMARGNDPYRVLRELSSLGELAAHCDLVGLPELDELNPEAVYLSWDLILHGPVARSDVDEIFEWVEDDCDLAIQSLEDFHAKDQKAKQDSAAQDSKAPSAGSPAAAGKDAKKADKMPTKKAASSGSIRVDTGKIDALINLVGELVITQSMLSMLTEDFDVARLPNLQEGMTQLVRHTRELQEGVMRIRMLPIGSAFSRFPRLVHDLSAKLGKKIELKMTGEGTEVDKTVIEKINDPLVHLVRNSLDHGIEMPHDRLRAGKVETGIIELKASHRGGSIVIEIIDDGKGLDRERILNKAIERGIVTSDAGLTDQQVYELIFQPGFSTADQVSDVSGRGVGMDVVRRNINELGGGIEIQSEAGVGSSFIIRLPLTLAILDGQTVKVGSEAYIVPLASIIESIQLRPEMLNLVAGRGESFRLREEFLPILRLHELFGVTDAKSSELQDGLLVVVEADGGRCGIFVDELLGQQQVVIKSLEANFGRVDGVSGATILGDGSVSLILDIPGLVRLSKTRAASAPKLAKIA